MIQTISYFFCPANPGKEHTTHERKDQISKLAGLLPWHTPCRLGTPAACSLSMRRDWLAHVQDRGGGWAGGGRACAHNVYYVRCALQPSSSTIFYTVGAVTVGCWPCRVKHLIYCRHRVHSISASERMHWANSPYGPVSCPCTGMVWVRARCAVAVA